MAYNIYLPQPPRTGPDNRTEAEKQRDHEMEMARIKSMSTNSSSSDGMGWGFLAFLGLSKLFD